MEKKNKSINLLGVCLFFALVLAPLAPAAAARLDSPDSGAISGVVTSPGGYPLPAGTFVRAFTPGTDNVVASASPNPANGQFQFAVLPNGLYVLKAIPTVSSGYTQSLPVAVSVANAPADAGTLAMTEPQVTGTVYDPDGIVPVGADVVVYQADGREFQRVTAPPSAYALGGLPPGSYTLQAFPRTDVPYWRSAVEPFEILGPDDELGIDLSLSDAVLWGTTGDEVGDPVAGARVIAVGPGGVRQSDLSSATGYWAIGGLIDADYHLTTLPPWPLSGLIPPQPEVINAAAPDNPYTLVFGSSQKIVTGQVTTSSGLPVAQAQIIARRVSHAGQAETQTSFDGEYSLDLTPGLWALTVRAVDATVPGDWVHPAAPQLVFFAFDPALEQKEQNFVVQLSDASITGMVELPGGDVPTFPVTITLRSDQGLGLRTEIDPVTGSFDLDLPSGPYKVTVHVEDENYLGPVVEPVILEPNSLTDLGLVTLQPRDAVISGVVSSGAAGVDGIPLAAWRPGIPGSLNTTSGPGGVYTLPVAAGTWHIQPAPRPDLPYLFDGVGETLPVAAGQNVTDINFSLLEASGTILGVLLDAELGSVASDANGHASAWVAGLPEIHNGAPIESGVFAVPVPPGTYRVAANLPPGSPYTSAVEAQVTVGVGETVEVSLDVSRANASLSGALWDVRNRQVVTGVEGTAAAWSGPDWAAAPIHSATGLYRLNLNAGLWQVNFRMDPQSDYVKATGSVSLPVVANQNAVHPLDVVEKDSVLEGTVLDPSGSPLGGVTVLARGSGPVLNGIWLKTISAADGSYMLDVPAGVYRLGAARLEPGWLSPVEIQAAVAPGQISDGHTLMFRLPDMTLSGQLTVPDAFQAGEAYVWAWSTDGAFNHGRFPLTESGGTASGSYTLGVIENSVWRIGAVFESDSEYWIVRERVSTGEVDLSRDLLLNGPFQKPAPVVVTFDASQAQHIRLADGAHVFIPAGAMPVDGQVTLRIVPLASLPHQNHANVFRYGYAFQAADQNGEPIEAHFNQDVVITFTYSDLEVAQQGLQEAWLKPAYFSTTTNRWTFPEAYGVDMDANRVVMQIDHFTEFALTSETAINLYMPLITR